MNPASAIAQVWLLASALVGAVTVVVLVVAGLRRCWWSLRSDRDPLWRAAGAAWGVVLLALAALAAGFLFSTPLVPGAGWVAIFTALTMVLLWSASLWTGRAPGGQVWPGRPTARPHHPAWAVGVWLLAASWTLLYWSASQMAAPEPPTVANLVGVSAGILLIGGLLVGAAQAAVRRSVSHEHGVRRAADAPLGHAGHLADR